MNTEAATTAIPDSTNPEPFQELPEVFKDGVRIPHSYLDDEARDRAAAAQRASQTNEVPEQQLDEEEVFELEQRDGSDGCPSLTPLDRRSSRFHTRAESNQQDAEGAARVAAANQAPRCVHIKAAGVRCQAPALRGEHFCYYHQHMHIGPRLIYPTLSKLEDAHGIQVALMEVLAGILDGRLEHKTGALLLYGLQTAVSNLKHMPEVDPDDMVTDDPASGDRQDEMPDPEAVAVAEKAAAADAVRSTWQQLGSRHHIPSRPAGNTAQDARSAERLAEYYNYDPDRPGDCSNAGDGGCHNSKCNLSLHPRSEAKHLNCV